MAKSPSDIDIAPLMPHRPPMLLVERVVAVEDDGGEAEARFGRDSLFVRSDGMVDEAVHFELVAQTFAACAVVRRALANVGGEPETGYLASLRSLAVHGRVRAESTLRIRAKTASRVEDFFVVDGEVSQDGRLLASCQLTILTPKGGGGES